MRWGKRDGFLLTALAVVGLVLLGWLALSSIDGEDPWVQAPENLALVGPKSAFTFKTGDRRSGLKEIKVTVSQEGKDHTVLSRTFPPGGEAGSEVEVPVTLEPKTLGLQDGKATLTITATDRSWWNFFTGGRTLSQQVVVDLVPLSLSFVSVSQLLHPGGTGVIIYRVNKTPKESGIRLGDRLFPGYPVSKDHGGVYGAFFPVPFESAGVLQGELVARPAAGSAVTQSVSLKVSPKRYRHDNITLSEGFMQRVAGLFPEAQQGDLLQTFLQVNKKERQANHQQVRQVCNGSQSQPLWSGAFARFKGKTMARFGDRRTYVYQNRPVDEQVHLGEDLASLVNSPVPAGNTGVVGLAEPLGIYGKTVILDHGLGVFSMYSHLSQFDVKAGDRVEKGTSLGRTGSTGLAGGDHLHFSIMIHGEFVSPVEWWDPRWLKTQVQGLWAQAATEDQGSKGKQPPKSKASPQRTKSSKSKKRRCLCRGAKSLCYAVTRTITS